LCKSIGPPLTHQGQTAVELRDQILNFLITTGILAGPPSTLNTNHLKAAITAIGNLKDKRSVQNWTNFLVTGGVLRPISFNQFQVIYGTEEEEGKPSPSPSPLPPPPATAPPSKAEAEFDDMMKGYE
jgi:hypothetical protein